MAHNYVVTAQHPTSVHACDTVLCTVCNARCYSCYSFATQGNFTSATDLNLIIARNTRIEILSVSPEGLRSLREFSINGSIEVTSLFDPCSFILITFLIHLHGSWIPS